MEICNNDRLSRKIVIGIPTNGDVPWQFLSSLLTLDKVNNCVLIWTIRTMIDEARNMLVKKALEIPNLTHLLMIDDDEIFPHDALTKLLNHNKDVVLGLVYQRREPYLPCCYVELKDGFHPFVPSSFSRASALGTGFILFNLDIFKKIPYPWFVTNYDNNNDHWSVDINFSKLLNKYNIEMYVDPSIKITHLGDRKLCDGETYNLYIKEHPEHVMKS